MNWRGRRDSIDVRSFSGPDYARVVIDLSDATSYTEQRTASNRLSIQLNSALVSSSLYGRRFIVGESSLLKRITVSESGSAIQQASQTVRVDIEVGSLSDYSAFRLSDPERIVIDLHAAGAIAKPVAGNREAARSAEPAGERVEAGRTDSVKPEPRDAKPAVSKTTATNQSPILGLPEIPDPIVPMNPAAAATQDLAAKVDAKAESRPSNA